MALPSCKAGRDEVGMNAEKIGHGVRGGVVLGGRSRNASQATVGFEILFLVTQEVNRGFWLEWHDLIYIFETLQWLLCEEYT